MSLESFNRKMDAMTKDLGTLPRRLANEAVNFSKERFRENNWVDNTTQPWKQRKPIRGESTRRRSRNILISSGRLRRSIRVVSVSRDRAVIGTDVPYATAHNYGYRGRVTQRVRSHERKGRPVRAHNRTIKQNIPQRQFIGESAALNRRLVRMIQADIIRIIR